jgi:hypothetical protein
MDSWDYQKLTETTLLGNYIVHPKQR